MKKIFPILSIILCLIQISCKKTPVESNETDKLLIDEVILIPVVYQNSFESPEDTIGWYGLHPSMFVDNPAPAVGNKSLFIGGGCIQPVAYITFDKSLSGHTYKLNCWGKVGLRGGGLTLTIAENDSLPKPEVHISVKDSAWTHYTSEEFICPGDKTLQLEIYAGGYFAGNIYLDYLSIEEVD